MTLSVLHNFHSAKSDGVDPTNVQPSNWNDQHVLQCASGVVLGRLTAGTGVVEEIPIGDFALTTGMTMTGALTGEDGGVWDNTGLNGLKKISVANNAGTDLFDFTGTYSGQLGGVIQNSSGNAAAFTTLNVGNLTHNLYCRILGTGFTSAGFNFQDGAQILTDGVGGMVLGTLGNAALRIVVNNAQKWFFDTDGSLHSVSASALGAESFACNGSIRANNSVGVNCAPTGVAGRIDAANDIVAFSSDIRLKTNIEVIENALDKVKSLRGFTYNFNEVGKKLGFDPADRHVGVSAQEVKAVLPEAVKPAPVDKTYMTVQYEKLVPLLIESIKELEQRVRELEAR